MCFHVTATRVSRHFLTRHRADQTTSSRQRRITNTEFLSYCNHYSLLINSYICIFGTTKLHYLSIKQPSPHCLSRGSSFAPVGGKIYDTLSTGNRPVYNTFTKVVVGLQLGNLLASQNSVHHPAGSSMLKIHGLWDMLPWGR